MVMNKVQKLAHKQSPTAESIRFSVTLLQSDNSRLETFAEIKGQSKSAFCSELLAAALDDFESALTSPEQSMNNLNLPSTENYVTALQAIESELTDRHKAFLKAHYHAPKHRSTATELAAAAGYQDYRGYNIQSANVGQMLADRLGIPVPLRADGTIYPSAVLVEWEETKDGWYATLHPQVAKAIEIAGLN
jgi:hypothetical protein